MTEEMSLLTTLLGIGGQFERTGSRIVVRFPVPAGWSAEDWGRDTREILIRFRKVVRSGETA